MLTHSGSELPPNRDRQGNDWDGPLVACRAEIGSIRFVAHAPTRAASTLMSMPADVKRGCRDESRHGTHECVRHGVVTFSLVAGFRVDFNPLAAALPTLQAY
jgi:hypothetical protein